MRHGGAGERDLEQILAGEVVGLADRLRDLLGLAVADADPAALVADDDEGAEAEATTALYHLGDAVDVDHAVYEFTERFNVDHVRGSLEVESGLAGAVGEGLNPAMIDVTVAVEHDLGDPLGQAGLGD